MKTQRVQFEICWALAALAIVCLVAAFVQVFDLDHPSELLLISVGVLTILLTAVWCLWVLSRAARRTFRMIRAYAPVRRR